MNYKLCVLEQNVTETRNAFYGMCIYPMHLFPAPLPNLHSSGSRFYRAIAHGSYHILLRWHNHRICHHYFRNIWRATL